MNKEEETKETNRDYESIDRPYNSYFQRSEPNTDNGSTERQPVKSDGGMADIWIKNFIRSENWHPKTVGFYINGQTGYAEFSNVFVSGHIQALTGTIGGFEIGPDYIRDSANSMGLASTVTGEDDVRFWAGDTYVNRSIAPFRVTESGFITASNGNFNGTFNIGGTNVTINNTQDIQENLTTIYNSGGGILYLQNGTYVLTSNIFIPSSVRMQGVSRDNVIISCGAFGIYIVGTNSYTTGTITINDGDTTVVGTGTNWTPSMVGQFIFLSDYWYEITGVTDATHIVIANSYFGNDLAGLGYAIANQNIAGTIAKLTIINASGAGLTITYAQEPVVDDLIIFDNGTGIDLDYVYAPKLYCSCFSNGVNGNFNYVGAFEVQFSSFSQSISGAGVIFTNCVSSTFLDSDTSGNATDGIQLTSCSNIAFISVSINANGSQGMEFISGNSDIQVSHIEASDNISDGIKLTATTDRVLIGFCSIANNGGYGINIAAATCDNNILVGVNASGNSSGSLNDGGTGTLKSAAVNIIP